jgi:hypothetical protein
VCHKGKKYWMFCSSGVGYLKVCGMALLLHNTKKDSRHDVKFLSSAVLQPK